jgi:uncharacterized tellurite resistance protein B-like protein
METAVMKIQSEFEGFTALYYLMIEADGIVTDKEIAMGKLMCKHEQFDELEFQLRMNKYKKMNKQEIYKECIKNLLSCSQTSQLRCMAWMSNIANCDGFMSTEEWKLLFSIYKKELKINQQDIILLQKQLPKLK